MVVAIALFACREVKTDKDKLFNAVISVMKKANVGFLPQQKNTQGVHFVTVLTEAIWFLDPQTEKFNSRSIHFPELINCLWGCRDLKKQHKKIPEMKIDDLERHAENVASLLMSPWFMNQQFRLFRDCITELHDGIRKYVQYLNKLKPRVSARHESDEPVRGFHDHWSLEQIHGDSSIKIADEYKSVHESMKDLELYTPLSLQDYEPKAKKDRRAWYIKLQLPYPIAKFVYNFGNYLGNLTVIWKLPANKEDHDKTEDLKLINDIREKLPVFATRTMRKDFINLYSNCGMQPALLRNMFQVLTGYAYTPESAEQSAIDNRVIDFLLRSDDTDLVFDLRKNNGRVAQEKYDLFWDELQKLLDEESATHERRQSVVAYLPFAISVADLREKVLSRLPDGTPAPSVSWICLQFYPSNPYTRSALNYSGRFKVRYKVQQRLLRAQHTDSGYGLCLFRYLKTMAVRWRDYAVLQCLDDKALIPVGEPGLPVSTGVRARHHGLTVSGQQLLSLDHDYHVGGIIPSVCFIVNIPKNEKDSFYNGEVHVTVKDKVFEASSPLRHAVETTNITREYASLDGLHASHPILFRYTDGGPDHRTTYRTVQLTAILEFMALDLDLMVLARTAPNQSYNNPAERVMSLLNLGLQNVSLCRDGSKMSEIIQNRLKSLNTLKATRAAANRNAQLKDALVECMKEPIQIVKEIFARLKWTETKVLVHDAATQEDLDQYLDLMRIIDPEFENTKFPNDMSSARLDDFLQRHCRQRHYSFQVWDCTL